jgi:cytochrome d ubiquinol oxidase subunit II
LAGFWRSKLSLLLSSLSIFGIISTVGVSLFPFILPSSSTPQASLLVWDASSSQLTLAIMLGATLVFLPIIIAYTTWVLRVMRGTVTVEQIKQDDESLY